MLERTPVLGHLPSKLVRYLGPERHPVIGGAPAPLFSELLCKSVIDAVDIATGPKYVDLTLENDVCWGQMAYEALKQSCALFAAEKLRGPKFYPYRGHFILGQHHLEWDSLLEYVRLNILAARDHGKSYYWTFAYPIWRARFYPGCLIYIFSANQTMAESFLKLIKDELLNNPKLEDMVPGTKDRFWSAKEIRTRQGSVIRARGYGVKVRGGHPNYIICDDVLGDEDIYSETIRRRNIDYYLSTIANMIVPGGQIVVVGTPMHHGDLYNALKETDQYTCRSYPALTDGVPLFPERYSLSALAAKRKELKSEARFAREFLCRPLSDEASLFPAKLFEGQSVRLNYILGLPASYWEGKGCLRYTGVDIAMSAEVGADYFWIFTIAVDAQGNRWLANLRRFKGLAFNRQIEEIIDEYELMRPEVVHIESNQAQRVWGDEIQRTTAIPIRRFFTTGVGGRQPMNPWKKGATQISVNKHHIDRGVPSLRMSLEAMKWRIPRGDANSVELTNIWIGEMNAIGWINGKVQSVAEHDDSVMACWMAEMAARIGDTKFGWLEEAQQAPAQILHAPHPTDVLDRQDIVQEERKALAAVQQQQPIDCTSDHYFLVIRKSLQAYATAAIESGQQARGVFALGELRRLDTLFRVGDHMHLLVENERSSYDGPIRDTTDLQASAGLFA